jgi:hypothetical protein
MQENDEDRFRSRQDGRVYPLGRALRATFDADNHATLGSDVTGLMIDLSKVPYEPMDAAKEPSPLPPAPPPRSWRDLICGLWSSRRRSG